MGVNSVGRQENYALLYSELFTSGFSGIGFCRPRLSGLFVAANGVVDLATMHGHFFRGFDPKSHLVTANLNHYDRNVIIDDNTFVLLPREHKHGSPSFPELPSAASAFLAGQPVREGKHPATGIGEAGLPFIVNHAEA